MEEKQELYKINSELNEKNNKLAQELDELKTQKKVEDYEALSKDQLIEKV